MKRAGAGVTLLLLWLPATAAAAAIQLDLEAALSRLVNEHPRLQAAAAAVDATEQQARSERGRLLPSLSISDEQLRFSHKFMVQFPGLPPLTARGLNTNILGVSAAQPLLGLLQRVSTYRAQVSSSTGARWERAAVLAELRVELQATYLRLFEAQAMAETATLSERTLGQQMEEAQARLHAGALTQVDTLRIQVAQAEARQAHIAADAQVQSLRAALLELLGLGADDGSVTFAAPSVLQAPRPATDLATARRHALRQRPELHAGHSRTLAAKQAASACAWAMLPDVDLVANYTHIEGQRLAPANAAYIGLRANWRIWEWGAQFYARGAAAARAEGQAQLQEDLRRHVGAEVAGRHAELAAAVSAIDVATLAVDAATEAFRVTHAQAKLDVATTTDLLLAESALSRARSNLVHARFEAAVAQVALDRSMGTETAARAEPAP